MGKEEAFEIFKRDYAGNAEIEEQKKYLKRSYAEAKTLGELINETRAKLNNIKSKSEQVFRRLEANGELDDEKPNPEFEALRRTMEYEKENYRLNFEKLKNLKSQIEHAQHLVERSSLKLQKDFEIWWQDQCDLVEARNARREEYEAYGKKPGTAESVGSSAASTIPTGASIASTSRTSVTNSPVNDKYYEIGNKPRLLPYLESDGYGKVYELFFVFTLCGLSG